MTVLVAGATGETGRRIVAQLTHQGIAVRALVRDPVRAKECLPEGTACVVGDILNPETLRTAIAGCSTVICATGARPSLNPLEPLQVDYWGTKNLVDAAKMAQVQQFVLVSSLCVSQFFHPLNLFWLILVWKRQAEAYLQQSGLTYTIVRPGGLKNAEVSDPIVMSGADTRFDGSIGRSQVAEVCIAALSQPNAHNQIVEIVAHPDAPRIAVADLFACLTK
ncbi:MAG: SDR family oxidoreductase [Thermosynechococcaceae cyanobacterium]